MPKNAKRSSNRLPKHVPVWRYYFLNRHVANLAGFYIVLLVVVLWSSNYLQYYLPPTGLVTFYAFVTLLLSFYFYNGILQKLKPRNYAKRK